MKKFRLKSGLSLDGVQYNAGESVELSLEMAEELKEIIDSTPMLEELLPTGDTGPNYGKMKKPALVEELEKRGAEFDPNAKSTDLVAMLEALDESAKTQPQE